MPTSPMSTSPVPTGPTSTSPIVQIAQSPKSRQPKAIPFTDFPGAMAAIIAGKRITKQEWKDAETYGELRDGRLMIRLYGEWKKWIINEGDLMGKDWIVI